MPDHRWSDSEKKIARRVFDAALERELAEILAQFKARAASATTPQEMWAVKTEKEERGTFLFVGEERGTFLFVVGTEKGISTFVPDRNDD